MQRLLGDRKEAARYAAWGMNILTGFEQMPYLQSTADLRWQFRKLLELATAGTRTEIGAT